MAEIEAFSSIVITNQGLNLLAAAQGGEAFTLTRPVVGDGFLPDGADAQELTELISEVATHQSTDTEATSASADITRSVTGDNGTRQIYVSVKNGDMEFYFRELGIMAEDADGNEVLFAYTNAGTGASPMPEYDGTAHVSRSLVLTIVISNSAELEVNVTLVQEVMYDEFDEAVASLTARIAALEAQAGTAALETAAQTLTEGINEVNTIAAENAAILEELEADLDYINNADDSTDDTEE